MIKPRETVLRQIPRLRNCATVILGWALSVGLAGGCDPGGRGGGDRGQGSVQSPGDFLGGDLTYVTPDGAVETRFEARLRPVQFTGSGLTARLSWSDDARSAEVSVQAADGSADVVLETDFSDTALLEALDRAEAETGLDAGPLRQWIAENPGRVQTVAAGEEPAPALSDKRSVMFQQRPGEEANLYISRLAHAVLKVTEVADRLQAMLLTTHPPAESPLWGLYDIARATEASLHQLYLDQAAACLQPCTLACPVSCAEGDLGACCGQTGEAPGCDYTLREHCSGVFWEGFTCNEVYCGLSGCCLDNRHCENVPDADRCDERMLALGAAVSSFTPGSRCAQLTDSACIHGACCYLAGGFDCDVPARDCYGGPDAVFMPGVVCEGDIDPCRE